MARSYTVVLLHEQDGRYSVSVPALPGCHTWGDTIPEALRMVEEAIECHLEVLQDHGDPVPEDLGTFTVDMGDAKDALAYRVTIGEREAAPVA